VLLPNKRKLNSICSQMVVLMVLGDEEVSPILWPTTSNRMHV
jgi:hypothetical protein